MNKPHFMYTFYSTSQFCNIKPATDNTKLVNDSSFDALTPSAPNTEIRTNSTTRCNCYSLCLNNRLNVHPINFQRNNHIFILQFPQKSGCFDCKRSYRFSMGWQFFIQNSLQNVNLREENRS